MSILRALRRALSASTALVLLAGCSGGSQIGPASSGRSNTGRQFVRRIEFVAQPQNSVLAPNTAAIGGRPATMQSVIHGALPKDLIFVSDVSNAVIDIFPEMGKNQKKIGQIAGLSQPQGLAADARGTLYIADTSASNVLVYARPYAKLTTTLSDAANFPAGVAVSQSSGLVGVANICSAPNCSAGSGSVSFYARGKTTACATVADANFARVYFAAFDDKDNLYLDGTNASGGVVVGRVSGGCSAKSIMSLTTGNAIAFPGGIQINGNDQIAIVDQTRDVVYTYNKPVHGSLGNAALMTPLKGAADPVEFAFTTSGKDLYTADGGLAAANEYPYPAGGAAVNTIGVAGQAAGIAIAPPLAP